MIVIFLIWLVATGIDSWIKRKKRRNKPPERQSEPPNFDIPILANDPNLPGEEVPIFVEAPNQAEIRPKGRRQRREKIVEPVREAEEKSELNLNLTPSRVMEVFVMTEILGKPKSLRRRIFSAIIAAMMLLVPLTSDAAPAWKLPAHGKILDDAAKQAYVADYMAKFFRGEITRTFSVPDKWTYEKFSVDGAKVERLVNPAQSKSKRVVLQLHGGGYVGELSDWYRDFAIKQAVVTEAREIWLADYRIAPENIYPAALDDAAKIYREMLRRGVDPKNLIVFGDSAGGNLALELSIRLREENLPQPALMILESPWTTFETDSPSIASNADRDLILGRTNRLMYESVMNPVYGGDIPRDDPRLSPIYADLTDLPPMLIQIGGHEIFVDECIELLRKATADELDVTLTVYRGMSHDFAVLIPELDDSVRSFAEIRAFVNLRLR